MQRGAWQLKAYLHGVGGGFGHVVGCRDVIEGGLEDVADHGYRGLGGHGRHGRAVAAPDAPDADDSNLIFYHSMQT